jgi:8-oxo-dGTP pyrophosphatase MutT (NUDIX family)
MSTELPATSVEGGAAIVRWTPHVTVATVLERDGRFLLVEERSEGRRVLNQPAGHWEQGETLIEACVRETLEEAAVPFTPTALVGIYQWHHPASDTMFLRFAFCGVAGEVIAGRELDPAILGTVWMTPAELQSAAGRHRSPQVARCVDDYLVGRRYPLELIAHEG